ncbi:MAG: hypothetical protein KME42_20550 [Tildeniella nuda ZEHNDER 1965/U140]|jgi:hypothetical protein|nr:hypothetical protein [Tildeniella nuda ZEHNDER 1965/U140]
MKRFLIALLGIGLSIMLGVFHFSLKTDAHPTTQSASAPTAQAVPQVVPTPKSPDLEVIGTSVRYLKEADILVFEQTVKGTAGKTLPKPRGSVDGAPVLGYVFPTTLKPEDAGFGKVEGILALAVTSHPDFDDTPLWDENNNLNYADDGIVFHSHWVVLVKDDRVPGGLSVKQFNKTDKTVVLPPTHPGMPMYLDSPGFSVVLKGNKLTVLVPAQRLHSKTEFKFDGVVAYMQVNATNKNLPMLGVYQAYSVSSGNLSLPYNVQPQ